MCSKRLLSVMFLFGVVFTLTACGGRFIKGSGTLITETREVSGFDSIDLSGSGEVIITQGGSESLSIETDDNVMDHIRAEVQGGTLKLGFEGGINVISPSQLVFYVGVDDLTGLAISGSGDVESDRIETDRLDVKVSGSGDVHIDDLTANDVTADISGSGEIGLAGKVATQNVSISGSGNYQTSELCAALVRLEVSGSGDATVCATETLDVNISGSGTVAYHGQPQVSSSISGSGSLNSLGE